MKTNYSIEQLKKIVEENTYKLKIDEKELFTTGKNGVHEQTISHRLALYFEDIFNDYNIDCEYNMLEDNPKTIEFNGEEKRIRPDIIVHKRHRMNNNLLCIEIKKFRNSEKDKEKLKKLTFQIGYKIGIFIIFNKIEEAPVFSYFINGEEV